MGSVVWVRGCDGVWAEAAVLRLDRRLHELGGRFRADGILPTYFCCRRCCGLPNPMHAPGGLTWDPLPWKGCEPSR